ncbi:MAG: FecR family protein, partial [Gemmatimonadaceae bacterium]
GEEWPAGTLWRDLATQMARAERGAPPAVRRARISFPLERRRLAWADWGLRAAAGIVIVAGALSLWRVQSADVPAPERIAFKSYETARGQQANFQLRDGSRVTLGVSSKLDVPSDYNDRSRDVYLQGQAYFQVVHDPSKPFIVRSGRGVTQVLGTQFGVRAYDDESDVEIVVAEGRVAFSAQRDTMPPTELRAGDLARLTPAGAVSVTQGIDANRLLSWTKGLLSFVNAPLPDVVRELGRWYDVDFVLGEGPLAARRLTTTLPQHASLEQLLAALEAALDIRTVRDGRTVTLYQENAR